MKIILFGTGDYYNKFKDWFNDEDIVCLLDNSEQKQNTIIDGKKVLSPKEGLKLQYDKICIVSVYFEDIKKQLEELGVDKTNIIHCSELYNYSEMIRKDRTVQIIDKLGKVVEKIQNRENSILLMSHDLDFNGATLALYYVACILKNKGYDVWFASWTDGQLRALLKEKEIGVIVDPRLQVEVFSGIEWMKTFQYVFCSTLLYYKLLSDRDIDKKYIWWLHEPELFYQSVDKSVLSKINKDNLKVYAVGEIARRAFISFCPNWDVKELLYGIPDIVYLRNIFVDKEIFEIISIGNVQEYKGQDVLIEAVKILPEEYKKKIHISIIGGNNSNYYNSIKEKAKDLGDIIGFIPPISREDIYKFYSNANLYVCSSRQDCMPVVVAESMMYSLPSIVSDATGIAPYIEEANCGLLFQSENVAELTEKIMWCIDNRGKLEEMGRNARKQYEKTFSLNSLEKNIIEIIRKDFDI